MSKEANKELEKAQAELAEKQAKEREELKKKFTKIEEKPEKKINTQSNEKRIRCIEAYLSKNPQFLAFQEKFMSPNQE